MSHQTDEAENQGRVAYRMAYSTSDNPYPRATQHAQHRCWDKGFWAEHDASFENNSGGIEEGYGNWYDTDAVSQGMYDDDPNPYDGTYSEE